MKPPVRVGELLRLREPDYCYGIGDLVLRVTHVPDRLVDPEWLELRGVQIAWNGENRGERQVRVRVAALRNPKTRQMP